jgi:hypothetical protein
MASAAFSALWRTHSGTLHAPSLLRRSSYEGRGLAEPTPRLHGGMFIEHPLVLESSWDDHIVKGKYENFQTIQHSKKQNRKFS